MKIGSPISCVYRITCRANQHAYIGSTNHFARRKSEHLKLLRKGKHKNPKLQRSFSKYGEESFGFEVVEVCRIADLIEREQWWINELKCATTGMNLAHFASSGFRGRSWSPEHRIRQGKRMKEWLSTHQHPSKGLAISEECKKRFGEMARAVTGPLNPFFGKCHTDETRHVMRQRHAASRRTVGSGNVMFGKSHSVDARRKIAEAQQKPFILISPESQEVRGVNLKKFCRENGLNSGAIFSVIKGRVNHHKGWTAHK